MKDLIKLIDKRVGIYIRKENREEDLSIWCGRSEWLKFELSDHASEVEEYIDEVGDDFEIHKLIEDIKCGYIEAVLLWSVKDAESINIHSLINLCQEKEIPILSFCEVIEFLQ